MENKLQTTDNSKQTALNVWQQSSVTGITQAILSPSKGLAGLRREYGEEFTIELVMYAIIDVCEALNVGKGMSENQILEASALIQREYYSLKPQDLKICFDMVKLGKFGETYNRVDVQVISGWLTKYTELRLEQAEQMSRKEHDQFRAVERGKMDASLLDKMKFYQQGLKAQEDIKAQEAKEKEQDAERQRKAVEDFRKKVESGEIK